MKKTTKHLIISLLMIIGVSFCAVGAEYPFPQNLNYSSGTIIINGAIDELIANQFKQITTESSEHQYEQSKSGEYAIVKITYYKAPTAVVSLDYMAKFMLASAYMTDADNSTQKYVDALLNTCKLAFDETKNLVPEEFDINIEEGVINSTINKYSVGSNANLVLALMVASVQWPENESYRKFAEQILKGISPAYSNNRYLVRNAISEISEEGVVKDPLHWPSLMPLPLLGITDYLPIDASQKEQWKKCRTNHYQYYASEFRNGFFPQATIHNEEGEPYLGDSYHFTEGGIATFNFALDYAWSTSTQETQQIFSNIIRRFEMNKLFQGREADYYERKYDAYSSTQQPMDYESSAFIAGDVSVAMLAEKDKTIIVEELQALTGANIDVLLSLLFVSGNMPNIIAMSPAPTTPISIAAINKDMIEINIPAVIDEERTDPASLGELFQKYFQVINNEGEKYSISGEFKYSFDASSTKFQLFLNEPLKSFDPVSLSYTGEHIFFQNNFYLDKFQNLPVTLNFTTGSNFIVDDGNGKTITDVVQWYSNAEFEENNDEKAPYKLYNRYGVNEDESGFYVSWGQRQHTSIGDFGDAYTYINLNDGKPLGDTYRNTTGISFFYIAFYNGDEFKTYIEVEDTDGILHELYYFGDNSVDGTYHNGNAPAGYLTIPWEEFKYNYEGNLIPQEKLPVFNTQNLTKIGFKLITNQASEHLGDLYLDDLSLTGYCPTTNELATPFTPICEGQSAKLEPIIVEGISSYYTRSLKNNSPITQIDATDITGSSLDFWHVIEFDENCAQTEKLTITKIPSPTIESITFNGSDELIYRGNEEAIQIEATSQQGVDFSWGPGTFNDNTIANPTFIPIGGQTELALTLSGDGYCNTNFTYPITWAKYEGETSVSIIKACEGAQPIIEVTVSKAVGPLTFPSPDGWITEKVDDTTYQYTLPENTMSYYLEIVDNGDYDALYSVSGDIQISTPLTVTNVEKAICADALDGYSIDFEDDLSTAQSVTWIQGAEYLEENTFPAILKTSLTADVYHLVAEVTSTEGCVSVGNYFLTVNSLPVVSAGEEKFVNKGKTTIVEASPYSADYTYAWFPEATFVANDNYTATTNELVESTRVWIVVADDNGCINTDTLDITVNEVITSISITSSLNIIKDESEAIQVNSEPFYLENNELVWTSTDESIATVDEFGVVTGVSVGKTFITANYNNEFTKVCEVTISAEPIPLTDITLETTAIEMVVGDVKNIGFEKVPADANSGDIAWASTDETILTLEKNKITAIAAGETTVSVSSQNFSDTKWINITIAASHAPEVLAFETINAQIDAETIIPISGVIADDKTASADLTFTFTTPDGITAEYNATDATITINVSNSVAEGEQSIEFTVTDTDNISTVGSLPINVLLKPNEKPELTEIPEQKVIVEDDFSLLELSQFVLSDDYTDPVNIAWSAESTEHFTFTFAGTTVQIGYVNKTLAWTGTETATFNATDEGGLFETVDVKITVSAVENTAPVFTAIPDQLQNADSDFQSIDLKQYISDDYTDNSDIQWYFSESTKLSFADETDGVVTPKVIDLFWLGTEIITITAADKHGATTTFNVTFTQSTPVDNGSTGIVLEFGTSKKMLPVGGATSLVVKNKVGATAIKWLLNGGETPDDQNEAPIVTYNIPGVYSISLVGYDDENNSDTVTIDSAVVVIAIEQEASEVCSGDEVSLNVNYGKAPIYKWSNGASTSSITVSPEETGYHYVTVTGFGAEIEDSVLITVIPEAQIVSPTPYCTSSSLELSSEYTSYTWSTSELTSSISPQEKGTYTVSVVDVINGCSSSASVTIDSVYTGLESLLEDDMTISAGGEAILTAAEAGTHTFEWNTEATEASITVTEPGTYAVTITTENGCKTMDEVAISLPFVEELGLVTVSEESDIVLVAWEKTINKGTASYNIYRQTGQNFEKIGSKSFDDLAVYRDETVSINTTQYTYRITSVDTAGNESLPSQAHTTIHTTRTVGTEGGYVLHWNQYVGKEVAEYAITGGADKDNQVELERVPSQNSSYTVKNPIDGYRYQVAAIFTEDVNPSRLKSDSGPFSQSLSNLSEAIIESSVKVNTLSVSASPVPATDKITIETNSASCTVSIVTIDGVPVLEQEISYTAEINIESLTNGVYTAIIKSGNAVDIIKLIKE